MKTGSYLAATLLAVTMTMATAGAQDPAPPQDPQAQAQGQGQQQGQQSDPNQQADPNGAQDPNAAQSPQPPNDVPNNGTQNNGGQNPSIMNTSQQGGGPGSDPNADQPYDATKEDPKNAVARISLVRGDVSMQRGDSSEWSGVSLNTPLVQGDQIATGEKSRGEIELDFANILRLAGGTQVKIADLERNRIQVQLSQGYASYSISKGNEAEIEIDTPNVAIRPTRPGRYRVQVSSEGESNLIVREGEAEVSTSQGTTTVKEGQMITIRGADDPEYKVDAAPGMDDWDRWNMDRDHSIQNASSWQNTNRYYTGSQDLDANGRWIYVPGYGQVWQPYSSQNTNWAPYQDGRWVWEPGWGWTWVSYEPWGWAPYHYGRWFYWNTGWVWWPGPIYPYYRPLWAPAYVSFFGFGGRVGFGFGFGAVGWLPCGPFDPFYPWYGFGFGRFGFVGFDRFGVGGFRGHFVGPLGVRGRMAEFSNIRMASTNARVRAGITSVSREDFARGGIGSRRFGADVGQLRGASMMTSNVPVTPTRESLRTGNTRAGFNGISSNNRFVTSHTPPAGPASFHDQASRVQGMINSRGAVNGNANVRGSNTESLSRGQQTFSRPNNTVESTRGQTQGGSNQGTPGWNRFGGNSGQAQNSSRGSNSGGYGNNGNRGAWGGSSSGGKPPLQMSKPMVTPRTPSAPTYSRPASPSGGYGSGGYGNGGYGGYNAPRTPSTTRSYGGYNGGSSGGYSGGRSTNRTYSGSGNYGGSRGGNYGGSRGGSSGSRGGSSSHSSGSHSSGGHSGGHR